jgi:hypothetical protein
MSPRRPGEDDAQDDSGEAPLTLSEAERAESTWLLARDHDPEAPPPSSEIASDYAEIESLLGNLPPGPSEPSWYDEVLRAAAASATPPRPWWRGAALRWMIGGGLVTAAAAIVVLIVLPGRVQPELEVAFSHVNATRSDASEVVVGDRMRVIARPHDAADLRVFRAGGILVARCPGGAACRSSAQGEYELEVTLDAPVQYQVILVVGLRDAVPDGTMDSYMDAARAANARIIPYPPIDVH